MYSQIWLNFCCGWSPLWLHHKIDKKNRGRFLWVSQENIEGSFSFTFAFISGILGIAKFGWKFFSGWSCHFRLYHKNWLKKRKHCMTHHSREPWFFWQTKKLGDFWETIFLILQIFKGNKNHPIFNTTIFIFLNLARKAKQWFFFGGEFSPFFEKGIIILKVPSVIFFKKIARKVINVATTTKYTQDEKIKVLKIFLLSYIEYCQIWLKYSYAWLFITWEK